jgi:hypothetical protein
MIPLSLTVFASAYSQWFICATCGFIEMWVDSEKELAKIRKKTARSLR